jgi:hypothetical protein
MRLRLVNLALFSAALLLAASPAHAEKKPPANAKGGTQTLYGITWHKTVDEAMKAAQKSSPPKPVFVWRMLGDLCGKT